MTSSPATALHKDPSAHSFRQGLFTFCRDFYHEIASSLHSTADLKSHLAAVIASSHLCKLLSNSASHVHMLLLLSFLSGEGTLLQHVRRSDEIKHKTVCRVRTNCQVRTGVPLFSSPEAAILLVSTNNRDFWPDNHSCQI